MDKINLMVQIWELYDLGTLEDAVFTNESSEYLKNGYNLNERKEMYDALKWAENNPSFHFESIMEKAPVIGSLPFSNEEVYQYLMMFKSFMENEDYNLLTDDRPTNLSWES
jgi:hypothetical protein